MDRRPISIWTICRATVAAALLAPAPPLDALLATAAPPAAAGPPCRPCAGLRVDDPLAVTGSLTAPPALEPEHRLYVAWDAELDGSADPTTAARIEAAGGTPWLRLVFRTPTPLAGNLPRLEAELEVAARLAAGAGPPGHFGVLWRPDGADPSTPPPALQYAFLFKRAAVAVEGARPGARVLTAPLSGDAAYLRQLYGEEIAAYTDGVSLEPAPAEELERTLALLAELDPGRPAVVDAIPLPAEPAEAVAEAARLAAAGVAVTLFAAAGPDEEDIRPLKLLAREFAGDLSSDPSSAPAGGAGAWSFVRGEDLALRVVAAAAPGTEELVLRFPDPHLRSPELVLAATGEAIPLFGVQRTAEGLEVRIADPGPVAVLRLERIGAEELEGVEGLEERVTVVSERQIPVEEILRRLQAFEDAQDRRLDHYRATNTTHLRFRLGAGAQSVEATFRGDFFFRQGEGFDWAWQEFFVNGVKWRGKTIPEIPLVQPEKAATLPLAIHLTKEYRYRLRGTATVDGRDAWVVDFEPAGPGEAGKLWQGTVWVDRATWARVRTRASQVGLEGEVLANEETMRFQPVDEHGRPAGWGAAGSFVLPLHLVGQQILSVVNATTVVEKETVLSAVRINGPEFAERREQALASDAVMVRDTEKGLRYLVKKEDTGERVVKEGFDTTKVFALGGVFFDDALDFPLPLAGVNYFSFDFRGTGAQVNAFFAGVLASANYAVPRLGETDFDAGAELFAVAFPFTDELFRGDREVPAEDVRVLPASFSLNLGHPVGRFGKVSASYRAGWENFQRADDTAPEFVLPSDNVTHSARLGGRYSRSGWGLGASATWNRRSKWEPWGLPDNPEFDPEDREYVRWQATLSKSWYLPRFQKIGAEIDYLSGSDLDRFSKYQFGFFGGSRVHGYQSNRVRAEEVWAAHLSYGFEVGQLFRLEAVGDAAWATDEAAGLEEELLGGVGLVGTFMGPWQTVVNLDVGVPVAGPDDGFVAYIVFLKLFR